MEKSESRALHESILPGALLLHSLHQWPKISEEQMLVYFCTDSIFDNHLDLAIAIANLGRIRKVFLTLIQCPYCFAAFLLFQEVFAKKTEGLLNYVRSKTPKITPDSLT